MKRSASRASLVSATPTVRRRRRLPLAITTTVPASAAVVTEPGDPISAPLALPAPPAPDMTVALPELPPAAIPMPAPAIPMPAPPPRGALQVYDPNAAALVPTLTPPLQPFRDGAFGAPDDGTRWVMPGKRKRGREQADVMRDLLDATAAIRGVKVPRLDVNFPVTIPREILLDQGNPTPSQVPLTEQLAIEAGPGGGRKRKLDIEPTLQLMVSKRARTGPEPGSIPLAIEGAPTSGPLAPRMKVRRTVRKGPVDVHMVDVEVPTETAAAALKKVGGRRRSSSRKATSRVSSRRRSRTSGRRRRRRSRRAASSSKRPGYYRVRAHRRRVVPSGLRYHPSILQPRGWEAGPLATPTAAMRAVFPVVRYHPTIGASMY